MLVDLGINAVSLANNHSCDCDLAGLYHTIELLDKHGIAHFGAGHNEKEANKPAIINCKNKTICLLGYLQEYHYLYRGEGYHPTNQLGGVNIYERNKVVTDVKKYKKIYDYVFVVPHWGKEGSIYPRLQEIQDSRLIIEAGADGVIASHAHIVQPTIIYRNKVIAMNLGNFAFPDRYVVKPRITYYPTDEELEVKNIPIVKSFKIVNELSYKVVNDNERKGLVLGIDIYGDKISINHYFTLLSASNELKNNKSRGLKERVLLYYVKCLIKDKSNFLFRVHKKLFK